MSEASESKDPMWHVYILKCKDGSLYTGITNNLQRRLEEHVSGKGGYYTRSFGAVTFSYTEEHNSRSMALKREAQIKGWSRHKKLALIENQLELQKKR